MDSSSKSAKRKFMQWASKWFYAEIHEDEQLKPDTPSLICLLQSIGFQLRKFEKSEDFFDNPNDDSVRIVLECGNSRMKAVMELSNVKCQCPSIDDSKNISMWSVSGITPTGSTDSINKIEETGSNLLPRVTKDTRQMIHDVTHCLINLINCKDNNNAFNDVIINKKIKASASYNDLSKTSCSFTHTRGHTNPEFAMLKLCAFNNSTNSLSKLNKPSSYDERRKTISGNLPDITIDRVVDPLNQQNKSAASESSNCNQVAQQAVSPKIIKTSPGTVKQLCTVFNHDDDDDDDNNNKKALTVTECLKRAKYYIEKIQLFNGDLLSATGSSVCNENNDNNDDVFVKPILPPPKKIQNHTMPAVKKTLNTTITSSSCNLSSKLLTQNKSAIQNKLSTQNKLQSRKSINNIDNKKATLVKQLTERGQKNYGLSSSSGDLTVLKSSKTSSILKRPKLIRTSTQTMIDSPVSSLPKTSFSPIKTSRKSIGCLTAGSLLKKREQLTSPSSINRLAISKTGSSFNVKNKSGSGNSGNKKISSSLSSNESSKIKNINNEKQRFGYVKNKN